MNFKVYSLDWFHLFGIVISYYAFISAATEYHILIDGRVNQICRQFKLVPFFSVNFIFRTLTISLLLVYWKVRMLLLLSFQTQMVLMFKEPAIAIIMCLLLINMWLTRRTLLKVFNERAYQHRTFCTIVGGFNCNIAFQFFKYRIQEWYHLWLLSSCFSMVRQQTRRQSTTSTRETSESTTSWFSLFSQSLSCISTWTQTMEVFLTEMFFLDATNPVFPTQWMNLPVMMLNSLSMDILYTIYIINIYF